MKHIIRMDRQSDHWIGHLPFIEGVLEIRVSVAPDANGRYAIVDAAERQLGVAMEIAPGQFVLRIDMPDDPNDKLEISALRAVDGDALIVRLHAPDQHT